jgi:hypothetical protein
MGKARTFSTSAIERRIRGLIMNEYISRLLGIKKDDCLGFRGLRVRLNWESRGVHANMINCGAYPEILFIQQKSNPLTQVEGCNK